MANGSLTDILRAKIRAILKTKVKNTFDQTPNAMDEIILLGSNDKGATGIPNPEINKKERRYKHTWGY